MTTTTPYLGYLTRKIKEKISDAITDKKIEALVSKGLKFNIENKGSAEFQKYYFKILSNTEYFRSEGRFFRLFKKNYSLQGIDNDYLDRLEKGKQSILNLLENGNLVDLYFKYFAKAEIKHKNKTVTKELGSFFSKFVHTFKPKDFCPLDNPVKNYFGLTKESFFISLCVISQAYKEWTTEH
ncbi:MAG: hypothetical protein HZB54_03110 [Deltaproteobacteria bacterium]|nr:hypothetical protein [Deltaproteobacteria bacterium]